MVRQLELVPFAAAEKLNSVNALRSRGLHCGQGADKTRRIAGEGWVEGQPVDIHSVAKHEVVVERDRATIEIQGRDSRDVVLSQTLQSGAVKCLPRWRPEAGMVGPTPPPQRMKTKGFLERAP